MNDRVLLVNLENVQTVNRANEPEDVRNGLGLLGVSAAEAM